MAMVNSQEFTGIHLHFDKIRYRGDKLSIEAQISKTDSL